MMDPYDVRKMQLKGYLREFYGKPSVSSQLWESCRFCWADTSTGFYGIRLKDDEELRQFVQAILLSAGHQLNWFSTKSYSALQDNLAGKMLITDYQDFDVVFITHSLGTMKNSILGSTVNQIAILRSPKKTFFLDRGGYPLADLVVPVVPYSTLLGRKSTTPSIQEDIL
jgi:hypothetical protein